MAEAGGTAVGDYDATDPEGDEIRWSLAGTDSGDFAIDANGVLRFKLTPDYEAPKDHNTDNVYKVTVRATATGGSDTRDVTVTVTDVAASSEPVVIDGPVRLDVKENWTGVAATLTATDPQGGVLTWSLASGSTSNFSISDTGVLSVTDPIDFETSGGSHGVTVIVTSDSNPLGDRLEIVGAVVDVNEAPVISGKDRTFALDEAGEVHVVDLAAVDPETDVISWRLSGPDAGDFIHYTDPTGNESGKVALWFKATPDYEAPQDSNKDNVYKVTVRATAAGGSDTFNMTVTVRDVATENDVVVSGLAQVSVAENTSGALATYTATDASNGTISWSLAQNGSNDNRSFFSISPAGVLSLAVPANYEAALGAEKELKVLVVADSSTSNQDGYFGVQVNVTDVNEPHTITLPRPNLSGNVEESTSEGHGASWYLNFKFTDEDYVEPDWSLSGPDAGDFVVRRDGGYEALLRFKIPPDYESPRDSNYDNVYRVTVRLSDRQFSDSRNVVVTVGNSDEGPVISGNQRPQYRENSTGDIATYRAIDPEGEAVEWLALSGDDAAAFSLSSSGVLRFRSPPDYEAQSSYSVTIGARDIGRAGENLLRSTGLMDVTVSITDINEAPVVTSGLTALDYSENGTAVVAQYGATDPDGDTVTWSVAGADANDFTIDASTGELRFRTPPDFERPADNGGNNVYNVTVRARDAGYLSGTRAVTVTVADVDEPPAFTSGPTEVSFRENSTGNVGTYRAADPEGSTISWSLGGTDQSDLDISSSGVLTFVSPPDRETQDSYEVTVSASDGSLSVHRNVAITITDQNEAPVIDSRTQTEFSLEENSTTLVGSFAAADPENDTINWSVTGTDANDFTIDADGDLSFRLMPDFESPRDSGQDNVYNVTVRASASGGSDSIDVTVTVYNVANEGVSISPPAKLRYQENKTGNLRTYTATDPNGGTIAWSLESVPGAPDDADHFSVAQSGSSGVLSVVTALDHEQQPTYQVFLVATSSVDGSSDFLHIKVAAIDVNEAPAVTGGGTAFDFVENDTGLVSTFSATDPEGDTVTWSLAGVDAGDFTIDAGTGELRFRTAPDFERPADSGTNNVYNVTVRARDPRYLTASHNVTVTVTDVDEAPAFSSGPTEVRFRENSTGSVGTYRAADPEGVTVIWSLSGDDSSDFTITSAGVLKFASPPDYETEDTYTVTVRASDGTNQADRGVTVTVLDVNEPPVVTGKAAVEHPEGGTTTVASFTAADPEGLNVVWSLAGIDLHDFSLSTSGVLSFKAVPDFERPVDSNGDNVYRVAVRARAGIHTTTHNVTVTVTNVNEQPAISGATSVTMDENSTAGITTLAASDPDGDDLSLSVSDTANFAISSAGVLSFTSPPDYEQQTSWTVTVTASDGALSATHTVAITINDLHDPVPPSITGDTAVQESENSSGSLECYSAYDESGNILSGLTAAGTDGALFEMDSSGCLSFANAPDYESPGDDGADNTYDLLVQATDSNGVTGSLAVQVTVTNVEEAPVITGPAAPTFAENSTGIVASYAASDPEGQTVTLTMGGSDAESFSFSNGNLRFTSQPDFEYTEFYNLTFTSSDDDFTTTLDVTVAVTNVNEAPTAVVGDAAQTLFENAEISWYYYAQDPELDETSLIIGGDDGDLFEITEYGDVAFVSPPDYESPGDADADNVYELTVSASDGTLTGPALAVSITVENVDEAPVFTGPAAPTVDENSTGIIGSYAASDPEDGALTVTMSGSDAGSFTFSDGDLSFTSPPDYESQQYYYLDFTAEESNGAVTYLYVTVTVNDVDEAPIITAGGASHDYAENGTVAVATYTAFDPEQDLDTWSLEGADAARFSINGGGTLEFSASPDYESPADADADNEYQVTVKSTANGKSTELAVTVTVTNEDEGPLITSGPQAANFAENSVGTVASYSASDPEGDAVSWSLEGTDAAEFSISSAGALRFNAPPDYETKGWYSVGVKATANGKSDVWSVGVTITNVDEGPSITGGGASHDYIEKGTAAVATYSASDPENDAVTWSVEGTDAGAFNMSSRGWLRFNSAPDFDSPADADADNVYSVTVKATANGKHATQAVTVTVLDALAVTGGASHDYAENGTGAVATFATNAATGTDVSWSLEGADAADFSITSAGVLNFASSPDFESPADADTNNVYSVTVKAATATETATLAVTVTVTDANDPPQFVPSLSPTGVRIDDGYGYRVATLAVTDLEGNSVTFSVTGTDSALFTVGNDFLDWDGKRYVDLSRSGIFDYENPLDADGDNVYKVTVRADDGHSTSDWNVTVTVVDVNEAHTLTGPGGVGFPSGGTGTVATFTVTDPDNATIPLALSGTDAASFSIIGGALTFTSPPNHQTKSTYEVTVTASDGTHSVSRDVTVTVVDSQQTMTVSGAPSFTLNENSTALSLGTYAATVSGSGAITWSVEGTDAAAFSISSGGVLSLRASPDFESQSSYSVKVKASSGTAHAVIKVAVAVADVNEPSQLVGPTEVSFPHGGTGVVATYSATDPDAGQSPFFYWYALGFDGNDDNVSFNFDTSTGELTFKSRPDYDAKNSYRVLIVVEVRGGGETRFPVTVTILPEDLTVSGSSSETVAENATDLTVGTYTATNPGTDTLVWSLEGTDAADFSISSAGVLSFASRPDFEAPADSDEDNSYSVTVKAKAGTKTATMTVTVTVSNVDEGPSITAGGASHDYAENGTGTVATYTASDPESDAVSWSLEGTDAADFSISNAGELRFASSPDFESPADADTNNAYQVTVKATAGGKSATQAVTVTVTNVDEGPSITAGGASHDYAENSTTAVATYTASDPENDAVSWSVEGADAADFSIDSNGALKFAPSPDFEAPADSDGDNSYSVTVKATANGEHATLAVTVTVTNVDEGPSITAGGASHDYAENGTAAVATFAASDPEGDAIVWSLEGTDAADFTIGSSSGVLEFSAVPDFESPADADTNNTYQLTVKATANGKHATLAVTVTVTNVDEGPSITGGGASHRYAENGTAAVATYAASDPESDAVSWSVEGTDSAAFSISSAGVLRFESSPDFESPTDSDTDNVYSVTVKATAGGKHATLVVTVTVTNVDEGSSITGGGASHDYAENGTAAVATYTTSAATGTVASWSLEGADAADFTISSAGVLRFVSSPDFESPADADSNNKYQVTVKATVGGEHATLAVTVTVTNVDEGPSITAGGVSHDYAENGSAAVAAFAASDPEGDAIVWSLEGTDAADFTIGSSDGALRFALSPDFESPADADTNNTYQVTVKATAGGKHATLAVTVTVTGVDEGPSITGGGASHDFAENGTAAVATYVASDPEGDAVSWSLEGADSADFTISSGGVLRFVSSPDFESPADADTDNVYSVTVKATAGGKHATLAVTVTVTGVNEAPSITGGGTSHDYAENGTGAVATYTTDAATGTAVSWSLEGADAVDFAISSAGVLRFATSPDFEAPADADGNNQYQVTVKATARGEHSTLAVTVTVTNVDEGPSITGGRASHDFVENGAAAVATYSASDPEGDAVSWTLEGADAADFAISSSGALRFASSPDFESPADADTDNVYSVTVKATANGKHATLAVTVTVTGVNEAPTITGGGASHDYAENGTGALATYVASDPEGDAIVWSLEGTDAADFTIDSAGVLRFRSAPDREAKSSYSVTVKATAGGKHATLVVTISITNVDEGPSITAGDASHDYAENGTAAVATYTASDPEDDTVSWSLEGADAADFTIDNDGALRFVSSPNFESPADADTNNTYLVTVKATANGKDATQAVSVTVTGVDESPSITGGGASHDHAENGTGVVATYSASDPEGDAVSWSLEGADAADFTIDSGGALRFRSAPDREAKSSYSVTVKATAGGKHATLGVTVTISNVDEGPSITGGGASHEFAENATAAVATYTASDPEGDAVSWSLEGTDAADFSIDSGGELRFSAAPDFESPADANTDNRYSVTVKATANGKSATLAVTVTVTDVADTGDQPPGRVTSGIGTAVSHNRVTLSWRAPTDGGPVTGYQILRRNLDTEDSLRVLVADTGSPDTVFTDTTVEPLTRYSYRVRALGAAGAGPVSTFANVTTGHIPPPGRVEILRVTATRGELVISAAWLPVPGSVEFNWPAADFYKVQWRRFSENSFLSSNAIETTDTSASVTVADYGKWVVRLQACSHQYGCGPTSTRAVDVIPQPIPVG